MSRFKNNYAAVRGSSSNQTSLLSASCHSLNSYGAMKEKDSVEDKVAFEEHEAFAARYIDIDYL